MVKTVLCVVVFVLSIVGVSSADPVAFSFPCDAGGTIAGSGDLNAATGALTLNTTVTGCVTAAGQTIDGTVTVSGTFNPQTGQTDVDTFYELTVAEGADSASVSYQRSLNGTYNLGAQTFNGAVLVGGNVTGTLHMPLDDLFVTVLP